MENLPHDSLPSPETDTSASALSRRKFLRNAALTGGGLVAAAGLAACAPTTQTWTFGPPPAAGSPAPGVSPSATAAASMSMAPTPSPSASAAPGGPMPAGWTDHDIAARDVIRRYLGNLAPALQGIYPAPIFTKLAGILGVEDDYPQLTAKPSFVQVPQLFLNDALQPLTPELDGDVKVFRMTIDEIEQRVDELMPPVAGLGYNGQWPGPTIRVNQGDRVRAEFTNNLKETTGVHFHGVEFEDFFHGRRPVRQSAARSSPARRSRTSSRRSTRAP